VGFACGDLTPQPGCGGEAGGDEDSGAEAGDGGGDAANQRADRVAGVSPEAVAAQRRRADGVADRGEQGGIDQGRADAEKE
jgi:hypothetical protein